MTVKFVQITNDNENLLENFVTKITSTHFRHFENRNVHSCVNEHIYTVIGKEEETEQVICYGHIDFYENWWIGICVLDEFIGKGYGKAMMIHLIDVAKSKHIDTLHLTVDLDNIVAQNLYKSVGFIVEEQNTQRNFIKMVRKQIDKQSEFMILPVSYGEAYDKLSILEIKLNKIKDARRDDVKREYDEIYKRLILLNNSTVNYHYKILLKINENIWVKQDEFRDERDMQIRNKLCIEIIKENDRRFRVKSKINDILCSRLKEQKGYVKRKVFVITHLGLGDNITANGMVRYLSTLYEEVVVVCKRHNEENVRLMYGDDQIVKLYVVDGDIDISPELGCAQSKFATITNGYDLVLVGAHSKSSSQEYSILPFNFYDDAGIEYSVFWEYFHIPDTNLSNELYNLVKNMRYIIIHNAGSGGIVFNNDVAIKHSGISVQDDVLVINLVLNYYSPGHKYYDLADKFVMQRLVHYKLLIENASNIYLTDSSVFSMAMNLDIKTDECYYISRDNKSYEHLYNPRFGFSKSTGLFKRL